jgi:hypothetical protein
LRFNAQIPFSLFYDFLRKGSSGNFSLTGRHDGN